MDEFSPAPGSDRARARERYERLQAIVEQAGARPPHDRRTFLEGACRGDAELLEEAAALMRGSEATSDMPPTGRDVGALVGPYRIERELGRGGMGSVFLARRADDTYQKYVAIKVIRSGDSSPTNQARFVLERQILADLEHPNIARLIDGGVLDDGRNYIVLEYVDGIPITQYADRVRLSVRERIALFQTVCAAATYAHQKLVIHRDLKPTNILVTADGQPKLLDFGIAKLLTSGGQEAANLTAASLSPGSPAYASPEQFRGARIDTSTDVFALGVVLHELLVGQRPGYTGPDLPERFVSPARASRSRRRRLRIRKAA